MHKCWACKVVRARVVTIFFKNALLVTGLKQSSLVASSLAFLSVIVIIMRVMLFTQLSHAMQFILSVSNSRHANRLAISNRICKVPHSASFTNSVM